MVAVNGDPVEPRELRYFLVNKPRGVASTRSDPHADKVIVDLVPNGRTLFPVGRLDVDTTGLLVLTNDGVLANRLMHPRYGVPKTYAARVRGKVSRRALATLRQGVELEDGLTAPAEVNLKKQSSKTALVEITIHEGRKRQVRRMFASVGLPVEELHRRRYGPINDKGLEPGGYRELAGDEVEALRRAGEETAEAAGREPEGQPVMLAAVEAPQAAGAETAEASSREPEGQPVMLAAVEAPSAAVEEPPVVAEAPPAVADDAGREEQPPVAGAEAPAPAEARPDEAAPGTGTDDADGDAGEAWTDDDAATDDADDADEDAADDEVADDPAPAPQDDATQAGPGPVGPGEAADGR